MQWQVNKSKAALFHPMAKMCIRTGRMVQPLRNSPIIFLFC